MKKLQPTPQTLNQLYRLITSGQSVRALPYLQQLATHNQADVNVLHLLGLAYASQGNQQQAKSSFTRALEINFQQPEIHNSYANFLKSIGEIEQARTHYQSSIEVAPSFQDGWRNLAILEYSLTEYKAALKHATRAQRLSPGNPSTLTLIGNIYRKTDRPEEALECFEKALSVKPGHVTAIYGKAQALSELERNDEALPLLEQALALRPDSAEIQYSLALTLLNLGHYQRAEKCLSKLLASHPLYLEGHRTLNEIYWQQGKAADFGQSYLNIPSPQRSDVKVAIAQVEDLLSADRPEEAANQLEANWKDSSDPRIIFLRARVTEALDGTKKAQPLYERAYTSYPELSVAKQFFISLIRTGQFDRCETEIAEYLQQAPEDQLLWALLGTCWKMLADERYRWLTKDNAFIRPYQIPTPPGFGSQSEFLAELRSTLLRLHNLKSQPLNQSVRAGIQTPGRLLYKRDPVIQALGVSLKEVISEYIAEMPEETNHPLLGRRSDNFRFSGSWSVLLKSGGHHVSHVHPQGWISSAFYAAVPGSIESDSPQGGDIYFGQSPYELGDSDAIEKSVTPKPGMLVLFPSFTWHGTVPLAETEMQERITAPFDVVPRQD
ncbi:2OG-Fe(II) oxygenase family protein [Microbulbifer guangxiensis]|uniref:2OG-Fe(II) oxygenase family protein n=1 Tax=Microbulbifer guangxiensis TaxID=2904249 RepID=UPI001F183C82|nr:tetratricopeptide repeat protein [Microbulbifer guangxiensis]